MTDSPFIAIAAGGTAGHINPALALAEELRDRVSGPTVFAPNTDDAKDNTEGSSEDATSTELAE